jgi:hypothetical protein
MFVLPVAAVLIGFIQLLIVKERIHGSIDVSTVST